MSLAGDFLEHASSLIPAPETKPDNIVLRRIVSALYYALFHQITEDAAGLIGRNLSSEIGHRLQRWF